MNLILGSFGIGQVFVERCDRLVAILPEPFLDLSLRLHQHRGSYGESRKTIVFQKMGANLMLAAATSRDSRADAGIAELADRLGREVMRVLLAALWLIAVSPVGDGFLEVIKKTNASIQLCFRVSHQFPCQKFYKYLTNCG